MKGITVDPAYLVFIKVPSLGHKTNIYVGFDSKTLNDCRIDELCSYSLFVLYDFKLVSFCFGYMETVLRLYCAHISVKQIMIYKPHNHY